MWWPALGGLVIGLGGLVFPQALGVGYDVIASLLRGDAPVRVLVGVLVVKSIIWSVSLGSGTSGGVLAPLVMMGGAFTVLTLRRSILTEKIARRGYHLSREYAIDPLEILFVREVMRTKVVALASTTLVADLAHALHRDTAHGQRLYPVVDGERLVGVSSRGALLRLAESAGRDQTLADAVSDSAVVAHPDEPLRAVVYRMAQTGHTRLPVIERTRSRQLVGLVSLEDLLKARSLNLEAERRRERSNVLDLFFPGRGRAANASTS